MAGISASFVRLVEAGRSDISLSRLLSWLALFGLAVGDVVKSDSHEGPVLVTRPSDWIRLNLQETGVDFFLTAPHAGQAIEPGMFVLAPGAGMRTSLSHEGEESLYIVSGAILLTVDSHVTPMETGSTAYFRSDLAHRLENASEQIPAVVLSTTSHPSTAHTELNG
jgi:mannose-6-phosphate isomerase-like protein (cupin superfamily)